MKVVLLIVFCVIIYNIFSNGRRARQKLAEHKEAMAQSNLIWLPYESAIVRIDELKGKLAHLPPEKLKEVWKPVALRKAQACYHFCDRRFHWAQQEIAEAERLAQSVVAEQLAA